MILLPREAIWTCTDIFRMLPGGAVSGEISEVASSPGIAGREGVLECSTTTPST
jgi:hypothetical protein